MKLSSRVLSTLLVLSLAVGGCSAKDPDASGSHNPGGTAGASSAGTTGGSGISGSASNGGSGNGASGNGAAGSAPIVGSDQPIVINECPGALGADIVTKLQDPAAATVAPMRWLYPYEGTVFPRGLESPLFQWDEPAAGPSTAVYVHISSTLFDYKGCLAPTAAGQLQLPQVAWETAGVQSRGAADPLTVELVVISGGAASKLPPRKLHFALAQLKNAIYYNTYGSALANQMGSVGGVVMRVTPKKSEPEVFLKAVNTAANCIGCHSVSADGSKLVAEEHGQPGLFEATGGIYDLTGGMLNPAPMVSLKRAGFSALSPDGSVYLTTGRPMAGPFGGGGNVVTGTFGPTAAQPVTDGYSKLIKTADGMEIPGTDGPRYALMPMFSTDGRKVVFNHLNDMGTGGHDLSVMDFDPATNKFSNLKKVYNNPTLFVGWPTFLPAVQSSNDGLNPTAGLRAVFVLGSVGDYVTQEAPAGVTPHVSDLHWVDVESGMAAPLSRAGGFEGATNFMPYGDRDAHKDYFPTVAPVPAGGYFWLFFSTRRQYGNKIQSLENANEGKKIWVAAIDINAQPGTDPSHPAFYLPGQESESGNVRAFAALSPCKGDGESCESGIDCCSGHCLNGICGVPDGPKCSELDEKCETTADCCEGKDLTCIGGFCSYIIPE